MGDIDRDHKPKDIKTVIAEMEEKHGEFMKFHYLLGSVQNLNDKKIKLNYFKTLMFNW